MVQSRFLATYCLSLPILSAALIYQPNSVASAEPVPASQLGTWAEECGKAGSPELFLGRQEVILRKARSTLRFDNVLVSRTYFGGARAAGGRMWVIASQRTGARMSVVLELPKRAGNRLKFEVGDYENDEVIRSLRNVRMKRCSGDEAIASSAKSSLSGSGEGGSAPAYVGVWATSSARCLEDDMRIKVTARGTEEFDSLCSFDKITEGPGRWKVAQTCHVEGTGRGSRLEMAMEGDRLIMSFPQRGTSTTLVRCRSGL